MNKCEMLYGLENSRYNDINSIIELLKDRKKILLIGIPGAGKTYTLNKIKESYIYGNVIYFDDVDSIDDCHVVLEDKAHIDKLFLNTKDGAIATIQGRTVGEGIEYTAELLSVSELRLKESIDYFILIKNHGYAIFPSNMYNQK